MKTIEIENLSLKEISVAFLNYADSFSFVLRDGLGVTRQVDVLQNDLSTYIIEKRKVSEWPGTRLMLDKAELFLFHYNSETALILSEFCDNLLGWMQPDLPEDLVFYKGGRPILISISHERSAYFSVDTEEEEYLKRKKVF